MSKGIHPIGRPKPTEGQEMKLNRRGEITLAVSLGINALALIALALWVLGNLWWVGDGYCWGSMTECYFQNGSSETTLRG